jgi:hypothetical protein
MTVARPDPSEAFERERVTRLKHHIARRKYRVDPDAVAQEILFKLRIIRLGRRGLLADESAGGDPPHDGVSD